MIWARLTPQTDVRTLFPANLRGARAHPIISPPHVDYQRVVLDNLPLVDAVVRSVARRYRLSADEENELGAAIRLKLVDRNYEVLRRFKNECSLRTYLSTVVNRHFLDRRIAAWGKWRPSALARRLGPAGVLLDQLVTRDGLPVDEAVRRVVASFDVSEAALRDLASRLPVRTTRRVGGEDELETVGVPAREAELIASIDGARSRDLVGTSLSAALQRLGPEDRLILKMKFYDEFTVARIAQVLSLDQKALYRRLGSVLQVLRREMEARGVGPDEVEALVGSPDAQFGPALHLARGNSPAGPSAE